MSGVDIAGLVEELRGLSAYAGDAYDRAADALLAQAAELAGARGEVEDQTREVAVLWEENRAYENDWDLMEKSQADALRAAESATRQRDEALAALKASEEREAGLRKALRSIAEPLAGVPIGDPWAFYADLQAVANAALSVTPQGSRPNLADATKKDPGTEQREAGRG